MIFNFLINYQLIYWTDEELSLTLSKQTKFICPQMLILCGLIQKIPMRLRRRCAYTIPAVMAAGNAGGTVMVMMSKDSITMVSAGTWSGRKESTYLWIIFLEQVLIQDLSEVQFSLIFLYFKSQYVHFINVNTNG